MKPQANLFCRDPVSISGYTPKFSRSEVLMNYKFEMLEPGRGLGWYDDDEPRKIPCYSIEVSGTEIIGKQNHYSGSDHAIVAAIANEYIEGCKRTGTKPPAYTWLTFYAIDLSNSARYWEAMIRIDGIKAAKKKIDDLQNQVRIGEILASVDAVGVLGEKTLTTDERYLLATEFGITYDEYYRR